MTIQWTIIASFLYTEIALIALLLLPFISPRIWIWVFRFKIFQAFAAKANWYSTIFIGILSMYFVDSIREMYKYSDAMSQEQKAVDAKMQLSLKLFRSQRNFYITGLSLFLWFVLRRIIILTVSQADLQTEIEKTMREAQEATHNKEKLLNEHNEKYKFFDIERSELEVQLNRTIEELNAAKEELKNAQCQLAQSSSVEADS